MEVKTFFAQRLNGDVIANPTVYLYQPDTVTLVAGLADKNGSPIPNPFLGTGLGEICFAAPSGQYDMRIVGSGRDFTTRVHFLDVSDAVNAAVQTIQIQGQVYVANAEDARDAAIVARDEAEAFAAQLGNVMLNDLGDVDVQTNPPVTGDGLIYNSISQRWEPGSTVGGINNLTDVDTVTTPPQHGDVLTYDSTESEWVPKPNSFVGCRALANAAQTLGAVNAESNIVFQVNDYDVGGIHADPDTTKFTVPAGKGGYWRISFRAHVDAMSTRYVAATLYKNNVTVPGSILEWTTSTASYTSYSMTVTVNLQPGDVIQLRMRAGIANTVVGRADTGNRIALEMQFVGS